MTATHPAAVGRRAKELPLSGHLSELRKRLTIVAVAVIGAAIAGWFLCDVALGILSGPVLHAGLLQDRAASLNFDSLTGAFDLRIRIAILLGVLLSSPVWLYQIFAFVIPGLSGRERKATLLFMASAIPLFAAGCAGGVLVLPHMVELLTGFAPAGSSTLLQAGVYYEFVLKLLVAMGVAFVLPVFLVVLNLIGVVTGHGILSAWRWAILAICAFTALATPAADVLAMFLLAIPMVVLYFAAVGIALIHDRRAAARSASASRQEESRPQL